MFGSEPVVNAHHHRTDLPRDPGRDLIAAVEAAEHEAATVNVHHAGGRRLGAGGVVNPCGHSALAPGARAIEALVFDPHSRRVLPRERGAVSVVTLALHREVEVLRLGRFRGEQLRHVGVNAVCGHRDSNLAVAGPCARAAKDSAWGPRRPRLAQVFRPWPQSARGECAAAGSGVVSRSGRVRASLSPPRASASGRPPRREGCAGARHPGRAARRWRPRPRARAPARARGTAFPGRAATA